MKLGIGLGLTKGRKVLPIIFDIYVDSVGGSDTNDGTEASPIATLSEAETRATNIGTGASIALKEGSQWKGQNASLLLGDIAGLEVAAYGDGALPTIDCLTTLDPAGWSLSAHLDAGADVYEHSHTRSTEMSLSGSAHTLVTEDGVVLERVASVAAVVAGTYYCDPPKSGSQTIYYKPTDSSDPSTNGRTVEASYEPHAVYNRNGAGGSYHDLHLLGGPLNHGSISGALASTMRRILVSVGGRHHAVTASTYCEDIVMRAMQPYPSEFFPWTAYYEEGAGYDHVLKRGIVVGEPRAKEWNGSFYSHGSSSGFDSVTYEQCCANDANKAFSAATLHLIVRGCYSNRVNDNILAINETVDVSHALIRDATAQPITDNGPNDTRQKQRTIEHTVVHGTFADGAGVLLQDRSGKLVLRNCVLLLDTRGTLNTSTSTSLDIHCDHCIFVCRADTGVTKHVVAHGTGSYTGTNNIWLYPVAAGDYDFGFDDGSGLVQRLSNWQDMGYDLNSLAVGGHNGYSAVTDLFVEDPALNGNFTLREDTGLTFGDGAPVTDAGPQEHWNFNARQVAAGPPTQWPTPPSTLAECKSYVQDPDNWNWYPA